MRGDLLDPEELLVDAGENFEVYGYYGVSVFVETPGQSLDWIAANKLARVDWLVVFGAGDILRAGLQLWDTGQPPHYDVVHQEVDELVGRLVAARTGSSATRAAPGEVRHRDRSSNRSARKSEQRG
ncbi:MAG: hypothetical protein ACYCO3_08265 [Mycobacteriales bacterium]